MPSFHLHLVEAHLDCDDPDGHDLPSLDAARAMALAGIRDMLGHDLAGGVLDLRGRIDIEDRSGAVLMTVPFADAVTIKA